jgi:hypothetical protein
MLVPRRPIGAPRLHDGGVVARYGLATIPGAA